MSDSSARLGLPYLQSGQAQKHVTHNEALERLDLLVQLTVEDFGAETPPANPAEGQVWALGPAPEGDWAGEGGKLAAWANGGWLFIAPGQGWRAARGTDLRIWDGSDWVPADLPPLSDLPGVGIATGFDPVNRLAVASPATLFTHAGAGHQLKINKSAATDTASLLFQTGFSGRAELGTAGSDDLSIKVSPDGATWHTAIATDHATGAVSLPNGLSVAGTVSLPAGAVSRAALADGAALSVIGRSAGSPGAVADIAAASDHQVLRRSGSALGFGAVALNEAAAVTGVLPLANGGTGADTAAGARTNLGLGTAATATVTTSATDSTANRLLKVGDFGMAGADAAPNCTNLDDNTLRSGFYRTTDSVTTAGTWPPSNPTGFGRAGVLIVARPDGGSLQQVWLSLGEDSAWRRRYTGGAWGPWRRMITIQGTVSQSGGVATGAIFERGSNSNGEYVRFADGTQICTRAVSASLAIDTAFMGGFRSAAQTWTYPAAFTGTPVVVPVARNLTAFGAVSANVPGTTSATYAVTAVALQTDATREVSLTAIGRWF